MREALGSGAAAPAAVPEIFLGAGMMAQRMREMDWSRTSLGSPREWPGALQYAVRMILAARHPACLWWGADCALLYNDLCAPLLGEAHPAALGRPVPADWLEGPEQLAFVLERHGLQVEVHHALALASIPGENGGLGGVMCNFSEVTAAVVNERQLALLKELTARLVAPSDPRQACRVACEALAMGRADLPFSAIYAVDEAESRAEIVAVAGIDFGHSAVPASFALDGQSHWPLLAALHGRGPQVVTLRAERFGALPTGAWATPPREAVATRLAPLEGGATAVLVAALNPHRLFNDDHRRFVDLVVSQVAAGITNAQARGHEIEGRESQTLQEIARDLASELDLQKLLQKVTDAGTRITGAAFGAFFYNSVDETGELYRLFTLSGVPRAAFDGFPMPRATAVFKPTFLGQGPVRSADITRDPRYGKSAPHHGMPQGHLPVKSYLAVPVTSRTGEVLGGLFFGHGHTDRFDERAERNAVGIAAQAAVAIDNANLFGRAKEEITRRSHMEQELRVGERRYRELVEGLPAAVYTTDEQGRIELFNDAAVTLWGREPVVGSDRWCGSARIFTTAGDELPLAECPMAQVVQGNEIPPNAEIVIERPDGTRRHALANPRPIRDERGRVIGAVNMLIDISDRKSAEAELAATKDELALQVESLTKLHELTMRLGGMPEIGPALQAILDTAVDAQDADFGLVWLHEPQTGALVVEASRNFSEDSLGFFRRVMPGPAGGSAGNAFAWHCRWVIEDIETDPGFEPFRQGARKAGFSAVHSTPIVTRGGASLGVISVHFARKRRPSQRDMQVADVCARHAADAIEARRGQEALRESERLYRAIGESIDYGVWICDAAGRNTYASESFLRLVGKTQEQCSGDGWSEILHPDDRERSLQAWQRCAATGEQWDVEHRVRGRDGKWHSVLARGVPVRGEQGQIVAWAGINLDIARLKQVEDELRELDQRKDEFLATLAHELRNPLAPLRNGLEVMRLASANPETVTKARGMMERQLGQMVRLVDDLLDVSRVSRGKIELRREELELATVLSHALETSQPLMAERGHQVVAALPPAGVVVNADLTRLAQVFSNLLNNAAKYTEPGGRVELSVRARGGEVAVSIKDNGIGIPPAMQAQVFDIFTQVDRSLEKSQGGLGIGLSIAKRLVEMHGGSIRVHSQGHRLGTEFVVRLPARVTGSVAPVEPDSPAADAAPPRHRVLVADDNPDSATTLSMMLEVMGNEVRTAHDGHEAVALAEQFRPDAILLDIGMPRMNGYDACERIRSQPWGSNAFIVALTGFGQDEDKARASEAGFDLHLVKPVEPDALERLIRELPEGRGRG